MTTATASEVDPPYTRLSVNIAADVAETIRRLKTETSAGTATEVVRRAIGVLALVEDTIRSGGKILVEDSRGKFKEVILL